MTAGEFLVGTHSAICPHSCMADERLQPVSRAPRVDSGMQHLSLHRWQHMTPAVATAVLTALLLHVESSVGPAAAAWRQDRHAMAGSKRSGAPSLLCR